MLAWFVALLNRMVPLRAPDLSRLDRLDGLTEDGAE
jgi:hypothetical protein